MYYKNNNNEPYYNPSKNIIKRELLREITKDEFDVLVYEINNPILTEEQEKERLRAEKELRLNKIVVTTSNGNYFDGNLEARTNMTSAIITADITGKTEEIWKLADNSQKLIHLTELKEALSLSIQEVGNIVKDY